MLRSRQQDRNMVRAVCAQYSHTTPLCRLYHPLWAAFHPAFVRHAPCAMLPRPFTFPAVPSQSDDLSSVLCSRCCPLALLPSPY